MYKLTFAFSANLDHTQSLRNFFRSNSTGVRGGSGGGRGGVTEKGQEIYGGSGP